jgi:competence protein ComEC
MSRLVGSRAGRWFTLVWGGFALGCGAGFSASLPVAWVIPSVCLCVASLLVGAAFAPRSLVLVTAVAAAVAIGLIRGSTSVPAPGPGLINGHFGTRPVVIIGTVRSSDPGKGSTSIIDSSHLSDSDTDRTVSGGVLVSGPLIPALSPGDRVEIDASGLRPLYRRPGANSEATLERDNVEAIATSPQVFVLAAGGPSLARAVSWAQTLLVASVDRSLPEPAAALTLGIAFGIHQPLSPDVRASLQDAGLIHVVVVSGLKVVLVIGIIGALARILEWSRRRTLMTALPVVAMYVLISGAGPAALRSAVMAGAAMLAATGARRTDPLPMLSLAAAAMLGLAPQLVEDPGFQLSFLGTAGIVVLAAPIARRLPGPRLIAEPFAVTVAAQLATVPVMAGTFGVISLCGPVANALALPLLPVLIVTGGAGAILGAISPSLGWIPLQVTGLGTAAITAVARVLTSLPGAAIQVGTWPASWSLAEGAGVGAGRCVPAIRGGDLNVRALATAGLAGIIAAGGVGIVASQPDGRLHVTVLNTGSSPAVLVRTGDGSLVLVDGGSAPTQLLAALGRVLPPTASHLDMVVITGGEQAAMNGLGGLPGHYSVGIVVTPAALTPAGNTIVATLEGLGADVLEPGSAPWSFGGADWRCLGFIALATARQMCALAVSDRTGRLLVLGDAGTADQEDLCAVYAGALEADLVVTPPGGAISPLLLATARPKELAVPIATGVPAAPAVPGYPTDRTSIDGDLVYAGGPGGLTTGT